MRGLPDCVGFEIQALVSVFSPEQWHRSCAKAENVHQQAG